MTKSREKLLNRAKKAGLSERKVAFLSREDLNLPEYFFTDSYWFVKRFSDEELEAKGYDLLVEMFRLSSSSCFKDTVNRTLDYETIDEIEKIVNLYKNNLHPFALFRLLKLHQITGFAMEDTVFLAEKASEELDPAMYLYMCNLCYVTNKGVVYPKMNAEDRHLYAKEGIRAVEQAQSNGQTFPEFDIRHTLDLFAKQQVPFSVAKENDFDFKAYQSRVHEKTFSHLNKALRAVEQPDKGSAFVFTKDSQNIVSQAETVVKSSPLPVTMYFPCNIQKTIVTRGDGALNIKIMYYDVVTAEKKRTGETGAWAKQQKSQNMDKNFVIFYSDHITGLYQKLRKNNKLVPMGLKSLFLLPEEVRIPLMQDLIEQGHLVFKDFLLHPVNSTMAVPPVTVNELMDKHNLNEVFSRYKNGRYFNWNKGNYQQCYVLMKAMDLVSEEDKRKITACKDRISEFTEYDFLSAEEFLCAYIRKNIEKNGVTLNDTELIHIEDYIKMCRENKRKIKISFRSINSLIREHNLEISLLDTGRNTLKIPKNSKFKPLRKQLPKEFVWIKNKNRLILEGRTQGHCVASYADYISRDVCAIYSVLYNNVRYTIEFRQNSDGLYYINQCQSKFAYIGHKDFDWSVLDYINGFLKKAA